MQEAHSPSSPCLSTNSAGQSEPPPHRLRRFLKEPVTCRHRSAMPRCPIPLPPTFLFAAPPVPATHECSGHPRWRCSRPRPILSHMAADSKSSARTLSAYPPPTASWRTVRSSSAASKFMRTSPQRPSLPPSSCPRARAPHHLQGAPLAGNERRGDGAPDRVAAEHPEH